MRKRWVMTLQWLVLLVVGYFVARSLVHSWADIQRQTVTWRVRPLYLAASLLLVWSMYGLLIEAWRRMLAGWDHGLPFRASARIWSISSVGKYIPGKIWAVAGMAVMAQRAGVAAWAATASAIVLQALAIGTGAVVAAAAGTGALRAASPNAPVLLGLLVVCSVAGVLLLLSPPVLRWMLALANIPRPEDSSPGWQPVAFGAVANLLAWIGYGLALYLLAHGLLDVPGLGLGRAIGAFAASYVAGLLFLPAPGGLGVRELVFVLMLQGAVGEANALALAVASRIHLTITELGVAAPFLFTSETPRGHTTPP